MDEYVLGIDIGGTTVKVGLFDGKTGEKKDSWEVKTDTVDHGKNILDDIAASVKQKFEKLGIERKQLKSAGVAIPGAVLRDSFIAPCVNLDGWGGFDLAELIMDKYGIPAKILNDASAASLGEYSYGAGKGHESLVMITLGTGVGGGVVINGRLISGAHGSCGEIGHMKIDPACKIKCGCGKTGCLERQASATGVTELARDLLSTTPEKSVLRSLDEITCKDVFDASKNGDPVARKVTDAFADSLGRAAAAVSCVVDPEIFIIGGGVSKAGTYMLDMVRENFEKYCFGPCSGTEFALATLGNDAGMYGAAKFVL